MIRHTILFAAFTAMCCSAFDLPLDIACCPASFEGKPVVNADQTVLIIWDPVSKMEHFIRQASFKSEADNFGFLIPTPTQPQLDESGNAAFPLLRKLTEPEVTSRYQWGPSIGCGDSSPQSAERGVRVLDEKLVAGFHAVVLEANSAGALAKWLTERGFTLSPEIEAWAKPYVEDNWKITAFKVAKQTGAGDQRVDAAALRLSFKTERPLFPYREPDYTKAAALTKHLRLLRIYFISDARYEGSFPSSSQKWTGNAAWSNQLDAASRKQVFDALGLSEDSVPATWWLTEFEDYWPYTLAPADVYFLRDTNQGILKRRPMVNFTYIPACEGSCVLFIIAFVAVVIWRIRKARASA